MKNKKQNTKKLSKIKTNSSKHARNECCSTSTKSDYFSDISNDDLLQNAINKIQFLTMKVENDKRVIEELTKRNEKFTTDNMSLNIGLIEVTVELAFHKKHAKSNESEKVDQLIEQNKRLAGGKVCLQKSIDAWRIACDDLSSDFKFQKSTWESREIDLQDEISSLKYINECI